MPAKTPVMMTVSGRERGSGITSRLGPRRIGLGHKRPLGFERLSQGVDGEDPENEVGSYCLGLIFTLCLGIR